jgi:type IV fimbrial biogenesis protein FimT
MKNHAHGSRPSAGGMSLLDLLVSVSVAGILAAAALPAFGSLLQDGRRTTVANELMTTVLRAHSEALLGRSIVVCGLADANGNGRLDDTELRCSGADWSQGFFAARWSDADGDGRVGQGELDDVLRVYFNREPGVRIHAGRFGNAPAGTAVLRGLDRFSSNGTITICDRRGAASARALILSVTGRARLSSRAADGHELDCS